MALVASVLATSLENDWLVPEGGTHPASIAESAQKLAQAVSNWFGAAQAAGFPCATAAARAGQLAAAGMGALGAGSAPGAGAQLVLALAGYMTGQIFGPGVATAPLATAAAQSAIVAVFADLDAPNSARAQRLASAVHLMATSTLVVFPPVVGPPAPIL